MVKVWDKDKGDFEDETIPAAETSTTEAETDAAEPEKTDEPAPGPLSDLQAQLRDLLDYDQIAEIRLALSSRTEEIEKHLKKAGQLGIREEDARRRLRLIEGSETRFGLLRIFAPEEATEQRDVFFDREKANGRPEADETVTFTTVDGRNVVCHVEKLWERAADLRALFTAGTLSEALQKEIKDQDFWHEIEPEAETADVGA